jgi:hypothetical protein
VFRFPTNQMQNKAIVACHFTITWQGWYSTPLCGPVFPMWLARVYKASWLHYKSFRKQSVTKIHSIGKVVSFVCFGGTGVWLSHTSSPFCSGCLEMRFSQNISLAWLGITNLLVPVSQVARITGMRHWCWLLLVRFQGKRNFHTLLGGEQSIPFL